MEGEWIEQLNESLELLTEENLRELVAPFEGLVARNKEESAAP